MKRQAGIALIEALIAIVIFSIGALTMIALQANGIAAQTDAQYRIEAANQVNRIIGEINLDVSRDSTGVVVPTSLANYNHNPVGGNCNFFGDASSRPIVSDWVSAITSATSASHLPGATPSMLQIIADSGAFNRVTITACWQSPGDPVPRQHQVIAYIN